jgi:3-hydroxyacyl-[acyl-carrier-protein] dehydratase
MSATVMQLTDILRYLPHRYPFLLVDRVTDLTPGENIVAHKCVTFNEHFFQGHFTGRPVMPGVLIIEAIAQAGGLLVLTGYDQTAYADKLILFTGIEKAKFRKPVIPGDRLDLECRKVGHKLNIWKIGGQAKVDGKLVAECLLTAALVDAGAVA